MQVPRLRGGARLSYAARTWGTTQVVALACNKRRALTYQLLSLRKETRMLKWSIIFALIALVAGVLGFTGVAAGAAGIAKILFVLFLVVAVVMLVLAVIGGKAIGDAMK